MRLTHHRFTVSDNGVGEFPDFGPVAGVYLLLNGGVVVRVGETERGPLRNVEGLCPGD